MKNYRNTQFHELPESSRKAIQKMMDDMGIQVKIGRIYTRYQGEQWYDVQPFLDCIHEPKKATEISRP